MLRNVISSVIDFILNCITIHSFPLMSVFSTALACAKPDRNCGFSSGAIRATESQVRGGTFCYVDHQELGARTPKQNWFD